jgi:hypothetical protein
MNQPAASDPTLPASAEPGEQVMQTLARQQRLLKWLTGLAIAFWAFAVIGASTVLICYNMFIWPKEQKILSEYGSSGRLLTSMPNDPPESAAGAHRALGVSFNMSYVITKGVLAVTVCVIILSCGTLATLLVVIFNRRVTLRQINHSLAQISEQLKQLQLRAP